MPRIALLSTSDTDLLSARASGAEYVWANPARPGHQDMGAALEGADIVVARILGGPQDLCSGFRRISATDTPMVVLGGEQAPNAALMELSTVPAGVVAEAHRYLAQGGPANLLNLHAFLSDTLLLTGEGFEPPAELPTWGVLDRPEVPAREDGAPRPRVGVLFYRAQQAAGNTAYAHALCDAIDEAGGVGVPIHAASLRDAPDDLIAHLGTLDALVTTVLAAGGTKPATASAGEDDEAWNVRALAELGRQGARPPEVAARNQEFDRALMGQGPADACTEVAITTQYQCFQACVSQFVADQGGGQDSAVPLAPTHACRCATSVATAWSPVHRHTPFDSGYQSFSQNQLAILINWHYHSSHVDREHLPTTISTDRSSP